MKFIIDEDYIKELEDYIEECRKKISIKNEKNYIIIESEDDIQNKEYISVLFSDGIIEDLEMILMLCKTRQKKRYIDYIIKEMIKQIIEYNYIMSNKDLIKVYFASEIDKEKYEEKMYSKKTIKEMLNVIEENNNTDSNLLYEKYMIFSEKAHNSYFKSILVTAQNYIRVYEENAIKDNTETIKYIGDNVMKDNIETIKYIVDKFLEIYLID